MPKAPNSFKGVVMNRVLLVGWSRRRCLMVQAICILLAWLMAGRGFGWSSWLPVLFVLWLSPAANGMRWKLGLRWNTNRLDSATSTSPEIIGPADSTTDKTDDWYPLPLRLIFRLLGNPPMQGNRSICLSLP